MSLNWFLNFLLASSGQEVQLPYPDPGADAIKLFLLRKTSFAHVQLTAQHHFTYDKVPKFDPKIVLNVLPESITLAY